ncbi:hypothetical protein PV518_39405 [Streptomyces sp. ND04-05B]|uniref:hypothetical protein n=1 Tax=Streptomyces sp. ND04-05B TaxID=3028693 RepID=UPI0029BA73C8|nr:hypothetical protein [Streptomyces sp. ND04-05B]MDX3068163.1 hypothetical protein [Streptomyces sp. ND04-05B]
MAIAVVLAVWDPGVPSFLDASKDKRPTTAFEALLGASMAVLTSISLMLAVHFKARLIRLDRTLAMQHTLYYRTRLEQEFAKKELRLLEERAKWERERDEWKAEIQNELYELILSQVDRGTLGPRPKSMDYE